MMTEPPVPFKDYLELKKKYENINTEVRIRDHRIEELESQLTEIQQEPPTDYEARFENLAKQKMIAESELKEIRTAHVQLKETAIDRASFDKLSGEIDNIRKAYEAQTKDLKSLHEKEREESESRYFGELSLRSEAENKLYSLQSSLDQIKDERDDLRTEVRRSRSYKQAIYKMCQMIPELFMDMAMHTLVPEEFDPESEGFSRLTRENFTK